MAERIPHCHAKEKKNVRGPGDVFFLSAAVKDLVIATAGRMKGPERNSEDAPQRTENNEKVAA